MAGSSPSGDQAGLPPRGPANASELAPAVCMVVESRDPSSDGLAPSLPSGNLPNDTAPSGGVGEDEVDDDELPDLLPLPPDGLCPGEQLPSLPEDEEADLYVPTIPAEVVQSIRDLSLVSPPGCIPCIA